MEIYKLWVYNGDMSQLCPWEHTKAVAPFLSLQGWPRNGKEKVKLSMGTVDGSQQAARKGGNGMCLQSTASFKDLKLPEQREQQPKKIFFLNNFS